MPEIDGGSASVWGISDEQSAVDHLRVMRWGRNDVNARCPHCGGTRLYHFADGRNHKCANCRKRFSIMVGTIFEDSKVALWKWFFAVWMITSQEEGIASTILAKKIEVSQKTAWYMLNRLRIAAETKSFNRPLDGASGLDRTIAKGNAERLTGLPDGNARGAAFDCRDERGEFQVRGSGTDLE